jgi:Tol biopolymer transport system component
VRCIRRITSTAALLALSLVVGPAAHASFPGGNGDIAFSRSTRDQSDIWIVDAGGTGTTRLTNTARRNEGMPDWNAAGARIAYSRCGRDELSNCEIWTMNADGSGATRLTASPAQETWPTWSPDGSMIAFTSNAADGFQDIWVMNANGSGQTRLTTTMGFDAFPEWSPDGTRIAFTSNRAAPDDIWIMDANGSNPQRLTGGPKIDERPDWSPDGSRIVFSRNGNIWVMDADGGNETPLTSAKQEEFAPTFSPNGRRIAYDRLANDGRIGVWTMRADGPPRVQRTFGLFDFFPDWQPV